MNNTSENAMPEKWVNLKDVAVYRADMDKRGQAALLPCRKTVQI